MELICRLEKGHKRSKLFLKTKIQWKILEENNNKYRRSSILESKVAFSKRAKGAYREISSEGTLKQNNCH
jgi:hypothetical protein